MSKKIHLILFSVVLLGFLTSPAANSSTLEKTDTQAEKIRIMVVSSYHREYLWSQMTNNGLCTALLEFGYLDNQQQVEEYTSHDYVESSKAKIKKAWMDTKRKNSKSEIGRTLGQVIDQIDHFQPDILLLGDDNAANYISNQYLDTDMPIVFWGINGLPLKYGIIDSLDNPGHNVTGVFQKGYHLEAFEYFQKLVPGLKRVAVLSDDSPTGRAHAKKILRYAEDGRLPVELVAFVTTNSLAEWQAKALELQDKVDGFYISTNNTLKDEKGNHVDYLWVTSWHLRHIKKPEITPAIFMVKEGFLSTVDDSAFKQGYEAMGLAHKILLGAKPAELPVYSPTRGPFIVNRQRAQMLGLEDAVKANSKIIDEYVDQMGALNKYPHD